MWTDVIRKEAARYRWLLVAVPLAGAVASSASFAICMGLADWLMRAEATVDEESQQ